MLEKMDVKNISVHQEVVQSKDFKDLFLTNWPIAKIALETLASAVKNPIVKWIINIVIGAGDALYEQYGGTK